MYKQTIKDMENDYTAAEIEQLESEYLYTQMMSEYLQES